MMMTQTIRTEMQRKGPPMLVAVAALIVLSLSLLAAPRPAGASIFYTIYTVNQSTDAPDYKPGDNICDVALGLPGEQCTLRAAIEESNATSGTQVIHFDIPGKGVHTIHVGANSAMHWPLPDITDTVTIDGYTQHGSAPNTLKKGTNAKLMIELDGTATRVWYGHGLYVYAPNVVIKGLVINSYAGGGIILYSSAEDCKVEGNFLGADPSGTKALGNRNGVGDATAGEGGHNIIGGTTPAARNLISGNEQFGVVLGSNRTWVQGNLIGTKKDGTSALGNSEGGVGIGSGGDAGLGNDNVVGGNKSGANVIAFNGGDGVEVGGNSIGGDRTGNLILYNSIFSNKGLGIDLLGPGEASSPYPTYATNDHNANDPADPDIGSNNLQNYPVITSAKKTASGKTVIKGKLNSVSNESYLLQLFSNPKGNEGKMLLGSKSVTTDASGNASFSFSTKKVVKVGQNITATTTITSGTTLDTSEISAPKKVVAS